MTAVSAFAPVSIVIVCPATKSATLATLMLVAPAADATGRMVAACTRKSVQLLSRVGAVREAARAPVGRVAGRGERRTGPKPAPEAGVGTRQPLCSAPDTPW